MAIIKKAVVRYLGMVIKSLTEVVNGRLCACSMWRGR